MSTTTRLRNPTARDLAELLRAPSPPAGPLAPRLRSALADRLAGAPVGVAEHGRRRIDGFVVERGGVGFASPFAWSARATRRVIGTSAARAVVGTPGLDPLSAARAEIDRLADRAMRGLARRGSVGVWLAGEPDVVRTLCAVEAASWATGLLNLVEAGAHDADVAVGIADAWYDVPGASLTLHGRRDAIAGGGPDQPRLGLLRLRDGIPGPRSIDGLVVDALIESLSAPLRPLPSRIVGAWPDSGVCIVAEFDQDAARHAARVVAACARTLGARVGTTSAHPVAA